MSCTITIEGDELLRDQLLDALKSFLEQEAEDQTEYEHASGNMTTIEEVVNSGPKSLVVTLIEPPEDEDDEDNC